MSVFPAGPQTPVIALLGGWDVTTLSTIKVTTDPTGALFTSGGGGGGACTIADGADVAEGALADVAIVSDASGSVSAKLRGLVKWAFERMPAALGQATAPGCLPVVLPAADIATLTPPAAITGFALEAGHLAAIDAVSGAITGAAVITDANATIQQYLRGIVKLLITSGTIILGAGTALIGKVTIANAGTPVLLAALTNSAVTVVGSAATLTAYYFYNPNAAVTYVQFFDISGAVTVGVSTPKWSIGIPPTSGANLAPRLTFANAIKVAATTTATGGSAPVTPIDGNAGYE